MVDVDKMTDAEIRTKLIEFGYPVMPITGTTRKLMVKKLKLLLENSNRPNNDGRMSLGRYSSEEESDTDVKQSKREKNRRITMAAPPMQPPSSSRISRKSARIEKTDSSPEILSPPKKEIRNSTVTTTTRTQKIVSSARDEFDTGSDSESDIVGNSNLNSSMTRNVEFTRGSSFTNANSSPKRTSPAKASFDAGYSRRNVSFSSATSSPGRYFPSEGSASEYAKDRLNQIRSRLSLGSPSYEQPAYGSPSTEKLEKEETPFLSNFTRRLSALSSQRNDYHLKNDIIKENDVNGSSAYTRSPLSNYRVSRGREQAYDYKTNQKSTLRNNFVSFSVLACAALFFIILAIMYLGMRSDTTIIPAGFVKATCSDTDASAKPGVNCVRSEDIESAVHLLQVLKPELHKRSVANKCFDMKIKAHMSEDEIISHCINNFALRDRNIVESHLHSLEILTFFNPEWGIAVVQTESNNMNVMEQDICKNMEQVIFNRGLKTTSLVILNPNLPWKCIINSTLSTIFNSLIVIIAIFIIVYLTNYGYKYYKHYEQKQKDEIGFMVERIIDILQSNAQEDADNFVVINHVRDMILPVTNRKSKEKTWVKAVEFINENESRVRSEVQIVKGEPFDVWRWIGSANLSLGGSPRNKSWQGQAFETQSGSVNSLPCSPTPCLKIRGMVEDGDRNTHMIKEAVLNKCGQQCRVLHCSVDTTSNCVYLKCAHENDAAIAYKNLHGWWYAGQLVTVKYLRLERYMQRFPDSRVSGPPFLKAMFDNSD